MINLYQFIFCNKSFHIWKYFPVMRKSEKKDVYLALALNKDFHIWKSLFTIIMVASKKQPNKT